MQKPLVDFIKDFKKHNFPNIELSISWNLRAFPGLSSITLRTYFSVVFNAKCDKTHINSHLFYKKILNVLRRSSYCGNTVFPFII